MAKIIASRAIASRQRRRRVTRRLFGALGGLAAALFAAALVLSVDWDRVGAGTVSAVGATVETLDAGATQSYGLCQGDGWNCVVDGDTFRHEGARIRIADIDTPEVRDFKCRAEKQLGDRATARLRELLSAGPFELHSVDRDEDVYGRKLRVVVRNGRSLGEQLVDEGLARRWTGARRSWC